MMKKISLILILLLISAVHLLVYVISSEIFQSQLIAVMTVATLSLVLCVIYYFKNIHGFSAVVVWKNCLFPFSISAHPKTSLPWVNGYMCINDSNYKVNISCNKKGVALVNELAPECEFSLVPWNDIGSIKVGVPKLNQLSAEFFIKNKQGVFQCVTPWHSEFDEIVPSCTGFEQFGDKAATGNA